MLQSHHKIAIFMEGALTDVAGKMGFGILRYSPQTIVCVIDSLHAGKNAADITNIPRECPVVADLESARKMGADVLILGIAPPGGLIPESWWPTIDKAINLGFSIVNGLHDLVGPRYPDLPTSQFVWDIRIEPKGLGVNQGRAAQLSAKRVLMIGTDMAIGKMTAGLQMYKAATDHKVHCGFVATGQIGMTIMGVGVPLDAIRVDFASGSIEAEMLKYPDAEMIIVEGQGALIHPGSTATLPLLRGSMPTDLVLCHKAGQIYLSKMPGIKIPDLLEFVELYQNLASANGTFPRPKFSGVCLNTSDLSEDDAMSIMRKMSQELGVPVIDPVRHDSWPLVDSILQG